MAAIITDQFRLFSARNLVSSVEAEENTYYAFIGLPNASDYDSNWDASPPSPLDSFDNHNDIWDTIIALKRIKGENCLNVVRKISWSSGTSYDMYRHDISRNNVSNVTGSTSLYSSNYYIINKDYRVYICLENGTDPEHPSGKPSLVEPLFIDFEPRSSSDGYVWKYLYTMTPEDVIKFDSLNYMPVPKDWEVTNDLLYTNALFSGQIKTAIIKNRGTNLGPARTYSNVSIVGDGDGAEATIIVGNDSTVESITISNGGSGYTHAKVDIASAGLDPGSDSEVPEFDVIIPPPGGHGFDIYKELGAHNVLIYARVQNDEENPDFTVGNKIARIGLIENPTDINDNFLFDDTISALPALKLTGINLDSDYQNATFEYNGVIEQTIGTGITAYGRIVSYDNKTGVLKYWKDRTLSGFDTGTYNKIESSYGDEVYEFTSSPEAGGSLVITGGSVNLQIQQAFSGISTTINNTDNYNLGQEFLDGISSPEVKKYSGNIIYIDNRPSITRSSNQKEDIKIVLQF